MIRGLVIREATPDDADGVRRVLLEAFGGPDEAKLVERLRRDGDVVLELVALHEGELVGQVLFSRLQVEGEASRFGAVALAPVGVLPEQQRTGIGKALIEHAHPVLTSHGEHLSIVLGDPAYYVKFGYANDRAAGFDSDYQGEYLQALAWGDAPVAGRLVYPPAFAGL